MEETTATGVGLEAFVQERRFGTPHMGPGLSPGGEGLHAIAQDQRPGTSQVGAGLHPARPSPVHVVWLGRGVDYMEAWELQRSLVVQRAEGRISDTLLLLEHTPVYTAGRRSLPDHVLLDVDGLRELGVPLIETDRGGQVTYHGPGQLVGYPILSLAERAMGPREYVRTLERVLATTLSDFGISAGTDEQYTGVWVDGAKVAAIGVKVSRGVTMHGFALNVDPDMGRYRHIVPCGIHDREVTSMARLLGRPVGMGTVRRSLVRHFARSFSVGVAAPQG